MGAAVNARIGLGMSVRRNDERMREIVTQFSGQEQGQDVIEYSLLLAFVCLLVSAIYFPMVNQVSSIWDVIDRDLSTGAARALGGFGGGDAGQDLIEYSLLLALICLVGAAFYIGMSSSTSTIWGIVNSRLAAANQTAVS